jgi:hypothetical protein
VCFYNECGWHAEVVEKTEGELSDVAKCCECHGKISPGEWRRNVFLQQYEVGECPLCLDDEPHEECETGETEEYDICRPCAAVLDAIRDCELAAGCKLANAKPPAHELRNVLQDDHLHGDGRYAKYIAQHRPDLLPHVAAILE